MINLTIVSNLEFEMLWAERIIGNRIDKSIVLIIRPF